METDSEADEVVKIWGGTGSQAEEGMGLKGTKRSFVTRPIP